MSMLLTIYACANPHATIERERPRFFDDTVGGPVLLHPIEYGADTTFWRERQLSMYKI
jgi:hypothetical protein